MWACLCVCLIQDNVGTKLKGIINFPVFRSYDHQVYVSIYQEKPLYSLSLSLSLSIYIYIHVCVCVGVRMCVCVRIYVCVCVHIFGYLLNKYI